jgi:hypothetical protein
MNYDVCHFILGTRRVRIKNVVGPILSRFGVERYYQSFVKEQEVRSIIKSLRLKVIAEKFSTRALKVFIC